MSEYKVIFTSKCWQKLEKLAPSESINEALAILLSDIGSDPHAFKKVEVVDDRGEVSKIRFVKTELFLGETGFVPPMVLFFGIVESRKQVYIVDVKQQSGFGLNQESFN